AIAAFDLADVSKNPAAFDPEKLRWMNGEYVRAMDPEGFVEMARPHVESAVGRSLDEDEWKRFLTIAPLVQERTHLLPEAGSQVAFLFGEFESYDGDSWSKVMTKDGVSDILDEGASALAALDDWGAAEIEATLRG